jgi:hypothetical protein
MTYRGHIRNGQITLDEPAVLPEGAEVSIHVVQNNGSVDLAQRQISPQQAENLRARLKSFEEDWQRPEMDAYDAL